MLRLVPGNKRNKSLSGYEDNITYKTKASRGQVKGWISLPGFTVGKKGERMRERE